MNLILDAGPLGGLCSRSPRYHPFRTWVARAIASRRHQVFLHAVADFEVRRELLRQNLLASVERLDALRSALVVITPSEETYLDASRFWADARRAGRPGAPDESIDADLIIAADAASYGATVVTENVRHFHGFVRIISPDELIALAV